MGKRIEKFFVDDLIRKILMREKLEFLREAKREKKVQEKKEKEMFF